MQENTLIQQQAVEVKNLKTQLQYQESSVVSHVLLKNPGGTVTLFAFGKGEGLSEHTAPFDALAICLEGSAEITVSGQKRSLAELDTIVLPANQPHAVWAVNDFKMLLVMIKA